MAEIIIIAGIARNNVIGKGTKLPWYIPDDLKRFKKLTLNHPVIMGRKTYESIVERIKKPLPERTNIVITRNPNYEAPEGVMVAHNFQDALEKAESLDDQIYIIGGSAIFVEAMKKATKLELTEISYDFEGDIFFPEFERSSWDLKQGELQDHEGIKYRFNTYVKR